MTITPKSEEQLRVDAIVRQTLEAAAQKLEGLAGNAAYQNAWKRAAEALRDMKPD